MQGDERASDEDVICDLLACAQTWEPDARLIGNVRAGDVVRALASLAAKDEEIAALRAEVALWQDTAKENKTHYDAVNAEAARHVAEIARLRAADARIRTLAGVLVPDVETAAAVRGLVEDRDACAAERDRVESERDALRAERDAAHREATSADRDCRRRDAQIAELRAKMRETRESADRMTLTAVAQMDEIARLRARDERTARVLAGLAAVIARGGQIRCEHCGRPATCVGEYETCDGSGLGLACDVCCRHGNEDGWCERIASDDDATDAAEIEAAHDLSAACGASVEERAAESAESDRGVAIWLAGYRAACRGLGATMREHAAMTRRSPGESRAILAEMSAMVGAAAAEGCAHLADGYANATGMCGDEPWPKLVREARESIAEIDADRVDPVESRGEERAESACLSMPPELAAAELRAISEAERAEEESER